MPQPVVKSRRQLIRLWFEFYKLALDDPGLQDNLAASRSFYEPWGNCRGVQFDGWYRDHAYLFGGTRVEEITRVSSHPSVLNVSIPLNLPVTDSLKAVRDLIVEKQRARLTEQGIDPDTVKSTKAAFGTYEFSPGEIRGRPVYESLLVYTLWLSLGWPAVNTAFCQAVVDSLRNRPRSHWIPHILQGKPTVDRKGNLRFTEEQLRQIRRYLSRAKQICRSVANGQFPKPSSG